MKPLKIIFPFLMIIALTACVGQKQLNIDEFMKKYDTVSQQETDISTLTFKEYKGGYSYTLLRDGVMITLFSENDGVINQCTVTADKQSEQKFNEICMYIIEAFTGFSAEESRDFFSTGTDRGGFHLVLSDLSVGKSMILNRTDSELNTNDLPTLKREVKEEDIARPTLSESSDIATTIKQ